MFDNGQSGWLSREQGLPMPDEYRRDAFCAAKAEAGARREEAIRAAHEAFSRAYLLERARHAAEYKRASAQWDALKSTRNSEAYQEAWRAFQAAKQPPSHTQARAELDRAINTADQAYNAELTQFQAMVR